jgi:hypothetical protein
MAPVSRHFKRRARAITTNKVAQLKNYGLTDPSALDYVARDLEVKFILNMSLAPVLPAKAAIKSGANIHGASTTAADERLLCLGKNWTGEF